MTIEGLPGMPGRPTTGKAKTAKERQRDYRNRKELEKVRRNNDLVAMFEGLTTHRVSETLSVHLRVAARNDEWAKDAKKLANDSWEEIGKRMGWL